MAFDRFVNDVEVGLLTIGRIAVIIRKVVILPCKFDRLAFPRQLVGEGDRKPVIA